METHADDGARRDKEHTFTIKEVAEKWGSTASIYQSYDSCMQTGFYTLSSMMKLSEAHSILEVACGTGRLLPHALNLKSESCTYLATDISAEMVALSKEYLSKYISKLGVEISLEEWLERQRLSFLVHNGEEPLLIGLKFDRIICNFVLHLTQSPEQMLKSLYDSAESGCLLGVTINGSIEESNFLNALKETKEELGVVQKFRSYAFLHNKFGQMAEKIGWEVLACWQQVMPYVFLQVDEFLNDFLVHILKLEENVVQRLKQKLAIEFQLRRGLTLSAQLYICRKK